MPNAPAKPTVTSGGARVVVSFVLPADNGDPDLQDDRDLHLEQRRRHTLGVFTQPQDLGETFSPITVPGVTNGKTYTCKVTATNDVGTSPPSPASAAVIPRGGARGADRRPSHVGNATGPIGPVNVSFTPGPATAARSRRSAPPAPT